MAVRMEVFSGEPPCPGCLEIMKLCDEVADACVDGAKLREERLVAMADKEVAEAAVEEEAAASHPETEPEETEAPPEPEAQESV